MVFDLFWTHAAKIFHLILLVFAIFLLSEMKRPTFYTGKLIFIFVIAMLMNIRQVMCLVISPLIWFECLRFSYNFKTVLIRVFHLERGWLTALTLNILSERQRRPHTIIDLVFLFRSTMRAWFIRRVLFVSRFIFFICVPFSIKVISEWQVLRTSWIWFFLQRIWPVALFILSYTTLFPTSLRIFFWLRTAFFRRRRLFILLKCLYKF